MSVSRRMGGCGVPASRVDNSSSDSDPALGDIGPRGGGAAQPVLSCISQVSEYNYSALYLGQEASAQVESQGQVVHLHWPGVEAEVDVLTWN